MTTIRYLSWLAAIILIAGCASTKQGTVNRFMFEYEGSDYQIVSARMPTGEGINYLIAQDRGAAFFRAQDTEQIGLIDTVLDGSVPLSIANEIYQAGILAAHEQGRRSFQEPTRCFEYSKGGTTYVVQTYELGTERAYNKFVVLDDGHALRYTFIDDDANGTLNRQRNGGVEPGDYQQTYVEALQYGMSQGRVVAHDGMLLVRAR